MENFLISEFVNTDKVRDSAGRKKEFLDRCFSCFIITKSGKIRFSYSGGVLICAPGHPIFLPKGLHYVNECLENAESYVINFITLQSYDTPCYLSPISDDEADAYFEDISSKACSEKNRLSILSTLYSLADRLFSGWEKQSGTSKIVTTALEYMKKHYANSHLSLKDIARECNISEVYLRKLFKKELKTTAYQKLFEIRMEKARILIEENRPIAEIAEKVGYSDVFGFSRAYKRKFAHAPTKPL